MHVRVRKSERWHECAYGLQFYLCSLTPTSRLLEQSDTDIRDIHLRDLSGHQIVVTAKVEHNCTPHAHSLDVCKGQQSGAAPTPLGQADKQTLGKADKQTLAPCKAGPCSAWKSPCEGVREQPPYPRRPCLRARNFGNSAAGWLHCGSPRCRLPQLSLCLWKQSLRRLASGPEQTDRQM